MDEIEIPVALPVDSDGFIRRECPTCEQEFKWYAHDTGDDGAVPVDQYFCPLCGVPSGSDSWWTRAQIEFAEGVAGPVLDQAAQDLLSEELKGLPFELDTSFSLETSTPELLTETDDMWIVEPPCHPSEPVKVPDANAGPFSCLVCGQRFAV